MAKIIKYTESEIEKIKVTALKDFKEYLAALVIDAKGGIHFNKNYEIVVPKIENKIKFIITPKAYSKMLQYVLQSTIEIAWHGTIEHPKEEEYILTDVMLYPQTVTAATVTTDQEKYETWLNTLDDETFNKLRFQGHSHVNMATNPSGVDLNYYDDLTNALTRAEYYIFLIMNKAQNFYIEIRDLKNNILYEKEDIELVILDEDGNTLLQTIDKEITLNADKPKPIKNTKYNYLNSQFDEGTYKYYPGKFDNFYDDLEEKFKARNKKEKRK